MWCEAPLGGAHYVLKLACEVLSVHNQIMEQGNVSCTRSCGEKVENSKGRWYIMELMIIRLKVKW